MITSKEPPKDEAPLQQKLSPDSAELKSPQSDQSGSSLVVPEKPSEDGYHWRKYGQKNVKGNEFIRSYYRCSSPNCHVKKQIERAHDGRITDTTYFGEHDHPKAHPTFHVAALSSPSAQMKTPEQSSAIVEDKPSNAHASTSEKVPKGSHGHKHMVVPESAESIPVTNPLSSVAKYHSKHDENRALKRRKKVVDTAEAMLDKPSSESRLVIETVSAVDIVNDGYRWRKYGQKLVRGNPNPRSYYRCSNPGCPAKKQVERASHDSRVVITAYEGQHDHDIPPTRTILPHFTATTLAELADGAKSKAEEGIGAHDTHSSPEPTCGVRHKKEGKINCHKASNLSDPRNSAKPKPLEEITVVNTPTLSETTHGFGPKTEGEIIHHEKSKLSDGVKAEPQERNCAPTLSEPTSSVRPKAKFLSEPTNGAKPEHEEGIIAHNVPTLSEPTSGAMPETEGQSVQLKTPNSSESIKRVKPEPDEQISALNRPTSSEATQGDKTQTEGEISCCSLPNISNPMIGANHSAVEETNPHEARDSSDPANGAKAKTEELNSEIRSTLSGPAIEIKTEQEETQCQDSANIPEQTEMEDSVEKGGAPGDNETKKSEQQAPVTKQEELPSSGSVAISSCPETKSNDNGHKPGAHPACC